ncbi:2Fe-2S iron-sulfur cluster-binding protein [Moraxella sp. FZLJ2107]|uniref:2Fe-2S iron-sulfur cluster-binding protein n=1 Tax=unclassified Moraxella TaxID=2685852 RepID=UPI0020C8548B|nr:MULTISPECIES: 2Fe-2S iron-sulfur cluster-binding protein [unclassified Moraxella]UTO05810.1 2Fe-2S iron-sulfur cluster-binding protein [Moraxella sp. FZLJ2107]UTO22546.1 2Fe-2S iron-sulfur cluster-binding protein [Moraxella sp. FZLJ2109]
MLIGMGMGWVFTDEMRFYLHENETLLDGMIRTEHKQVRYECRQGYCGACRMRVTAKTGGFHHRLPPLVQLADDEVLACCCVVSGSLQVSYLPPTEQLSLFAKPSPMDD